MQQRVGLARALAADPEIILMDEPFSALDPLIRRQLQDEFRQLTKDLGKSAVFITHDLDEAIRIGDRIAIMKDGVIIQVGTAEEIVLEARPTPTSREFVAGISRLHLDQGALGDGSGRRVQRAQPAGPMSPRSPGPSPEADIDELIDLIMRSTAATASRSWTNGAIVGVVTPRSLLHGRQGRGRASPPRAQLRA